MDNRGKDVGNTKMKTRLNFRKNGLLITLLKFRDNTKLIVFETMAKFEIDNPGTTEVFPNIFRPDT